MPLEMLAIAATYASDNPNCNEMEIVFEYFPPFDTYKAGWWIDVITYSGNDGVIGYFR